MNPDELKISIHALLAESDATATDTYTHVFKFLSTLSLRRATQTKTFKVSALSISIHALLAESDASGQPERQEQRISIHALLAESDADKDADWVRVYVFLSTLSLRRATKLRNPSRPGKINFYPRSPCGERHCTSIGRPKRLYFYPRSPCGERQLYINRTAKAIVFLSTLSLRRATTVHQ